MLEMFIINYKSDKTISSRKFETLFFHIILNMPSNEYMINTKNFLSKSDYIRLICGAKSSLDHQHQYHIVNRMTSLKISLLDLHGIYFPFTTTKSINSNIFRMGKRFSDLKKKKKKSSMRER